MPSPSRKTKKTSQRLRFSKRVTVRHIAKKKQPITFVANLPEEREWGSNTEQPIRGRGAETPSANALAARYHAHAADPARHKNPIGAYTRKLLPALYPHAHHALREHDDPRYRAILEAALPLRNVHAEVAHVRAVHSHATGALNLPAQASRVSGITHPEEVIHDEEEHEEFQYRQAMARYRRAKEEYNANPFKVGSSPKRPQKPRRPTLANAYAAEGTPV